MKDMTILAGVLYGVLFFIFGLQMIFLLYLNYNDQFYPSFFLYFFCIVVIDRYLRREKEYRDLLIKNSSL